jgi:hypothetical protein
VTIYRTDDPARWGNGIGRDLTAAEIDLNFYGHELRLTNLENNPPLPDSIANIGVSGTQLSITLQSGTIFGPFPLPVLMFRWRGDWAPATSYAQLDTFRVTGQGLYVVLVDHTSSAGTFAEGAVDGTGAALYLKLFGFSGAAGVHVSDLVDVALTSLADKQILQWNATDGKWENVNPGIVTGLASLSDVLFTGLINNQVLRYDSASGKWKNVLLGSMADQNASAVAITGGTITGLSDPSVNSDVATKHYVDLVGAGGLPSIGDGLLLANETGGSHTPSGVSLTSLLDYVMGNARGSVLFRGASGWVVLTPGTAGQFLKTGGAGADVSWAAPSGSGTVTSITAGTGLAGGTITNTGTISLGTVADGDLLANTSGGVAVPIATTLSALIDYALSSLRGAILYRGASGWTALAPSTSGKFLKTQGSGADPVWDSPAGSGTVTSITAGTGLSGGTITTTGTIALAAIADADLLANTSGGSAAPVPTTLSALIDYALGSTRGDVLYRGASGWAVLTPGTAGQVLSTGGAGADPSWVNSGTGSAIADARILANISGGSAIAAANTLTNILDYILGSSQGDLIQRGASAWVVLAPGTAGQVLKTGGAAANNVWADIAGILDAISSTRGTILYRGATTWVALSPGTSGQLLATQGAGADPQWITASGTGTVTSVATGNGLTGGTITGSGTVSMDDTSFAARNLSLHATCSGV